MDIEYINEPYIEAIVIDDDYYNLSTSHYEILKYQLPSLDNFISQKKPRSPANAYRCEKAFKAFIKNQRRRSKK